MKDVRRELLDEFEDCLEEATQESIERAKKQDKEERLPTGIGSYEVFGNISGLFIKKIADLHEQVAALQAVVLKKKHKRKDK